MSEKVEEVTGEAKVVETEETTPPPGESEKVAELEKRVHGLESGIANERKKRQIAERMAAEVKPEDKPQPEAPEQPQDVRRVVSDVLSQEREQQRIAQENQAWNDRLQKAKEQHPDVENIIHDETFFPYFTDDMATAVRTADDGVDVMLYLNEHRDELQTISRLHPTQAALEMGRISERLKADQKARVSNAPDPITPVGSNSVSEKDPDDMSPAEYEEWARSKRGGTVFVS